MPQSLISSTPELGFFIKPSTNPNLCLTLKSLRISFTHFNNWGCREIRYGHYLTWICSSWQVVIRQDCDITTNFSLWFTHNWVCTVVDNHGINDTRKAKRKFCWLISESTRNRKQRAIETEKQTRKKKKIGLKQPSLWYHVNIAETLCIFIDLAKYLYIQDNP